MALIVDYYIRTKSRKEKEKIIYGMEREFTLLNTINSHGHGW